MNQATVEPGLRPRVEVHDRRFVLDSDQQHVAERLDSLCQALGAMPAKPNPWLRFFHSLFDKTDRREPAVRGLYIWGMVGRGKTWLMDGFYEALPFADKLRLHFYRFMHETHRELRGLRHQPDPLRIVARRLRKRARIVCLDELFVADIADAMILGNLFEAMLQNGIILVTTSNSAPDELYRDGLQRVRFLPAIKLIKQNLDVCHLGGNIDYRLRMLERAKLYLFPADAVADEALLCSFRNFAGGAGTAGHLEIEHRRIPARQMADGVVWFRFADICDAPRSQVDYIEISRCYHTVLISGVPQFTRDQENQARRFIALVDEFYDRRVKLVLSAEVPLETLYAGRRLSFEFQRTRSRLVEMQGHDYLASAHRP